MTRITPELPDGFDPRALEAAARAAQAYSEQASTAFATFDSRAMAKAITAVIRSSKLLTPDPKTLSLMGEAIRNSSSASRRDAEALASVLRTVNSQSVASLRKAVEQLDFASFELSPEMTEKLREAAQAMPEIDPTEFASRTAEALNESSDAAGLPEIQQAAASILLDSPDLSKRPLKFLPEIVSVISLLVTLTAHLTENQRLEVGGTATHIAAIFIAIYLHLSE